MALDEIDAVREPDQLAQHADCRECQYEGDHRNLHTIGGVLGVPPTIEWGLVVVGSEGNDLSDSYGLHPLTYIRGRESSEPRDWQFLTPRWNRQS